METKLHSYIFLLPTFVYLVNSSPITIETKHDQQLSEPLGNKDNYHDTINIYNSGATLGNGNVESILERLKSIKEHLGKIEGQVVDNGEAFQEMEEHAGNEDVEEGIAQEVLFDGGTPGASNSVSSSSTFSPTNAFGESSPSTGWATCQNLPQMVFYQFHSAITVTRFSFGARKDGDLPQAATEFQLIGTNDHVCNHGSKWETVATHGTGFTRVGEVKFWDVSIPKQKSYSCWGINVFKNQGSSCTAIRAFRMWKKV